MFGGCRLSSVSPSTSPPGIIAPQTPKDYFLANVPDEIADLIIEHEVYLARLSAGSAKKIVSALGKLRRELIKEIAATDSVSKRARMQILKKQADILIKRSFSAINEQQAKDAVEIADLESKFSASVINDAVGVTLVSASLPARTLEAMVDKNLVFGAPAKEWWGRQSVTSRQHFADQMAMGILQGESIKELSNRVDTILAPIRRNAEALARTSVLSVTNASRFATYEDNSDLIKGVQALAVLDNRTTQLCMSRDGLAWTLAGDPIGDTSQPFPGPPPWHWNCRSTLVPLLKSFDELAGPRADKDLLSKLRTLPKSTRASMDGQVPSTINYEQWLKKKDAANPGFAEGILGKTKYQIWKSGNLSFSEMVNQSGIPYTVKELRELYADKFKRLEG